MTGWSRLLLTVAYYVSRQAGFNRGSEGQSFMLPYALTSDINKLASESNVGVPGIWVYRVDVANVGG